MQIRVLNCRDRWLWITSKQTQIRLTETVTELSDMFLQSVISDIMILHVEFVQLLEQVLKKVEILIPLRQEQM